MALFFKWKEYMFSGTYYKNILLIGYKDIFRNTLYIFLLSVFIILLFKLFSRRKSYINYLSLALFSAYTALVLQLTVIGRTYREETLIKLFEGWGELSEKELMEAYTNCIMLLPFAFLLLIGIGNVLFEKASFIRIILFSTMISFVFSLSIELSQMHWKRGTFQIADLIYNTCGGIIAGFIYWIFAILNAYIEITIEKIHKKLSKKTAE